MEVDHEPLERIIYISRRRPEVPTLDRARVERFERNNARDRLTGALFVFGDRYLQYLEGPAASVRQLLALIREDASHVDMQVLMEATGSQRYFGQWHMRLLRPNAITLAHAQRMIGSLTANDPEAGMRAFDLLWSAAHEVPGI